MKGSRMSLPTQMAIGMVLGIAAGALTPAMGLDPSWYKPVGQLFINLVRMVVVPLVLTTLVAGAASVGDVSKLGRVAGKTLAYYLVTTAVAVVIGLVLANIFQPGSGLSISTEGLKAKEVAPPTLIDVFLNIVPINPIEALSKGNMLQIIFFALLFGFGLSVIGDKGKQVLHFFDGAADVMIKVTGFVMLYAPIGVFGLMAYTVSMHGLSVLLPLIKLVLVMYLACILQILIVYLPCVKVTGLTPSRFLKGLASPMMIAFTTCSSAAALSTTLLSVQKLGASRSVSSFSIPLGNTINMDGAAIYMGIAAIFAAEVYGIPMPLDRQLTVILLAVLASIGSMGVPGAALIMITMVFTQVGIPLEAIALVAGVDRIMDMARTTINVLGDATGALFVSKLESDFDPERGVGPPAGLDLTRKLFDHTRAEADQEHLPVMLYSFPDRIGERPAFLLGKTADNPGEAIGDIMAELARAGATVIGMPCNTAHSPRILDAALEKLNATGRPVRFVHMIDAVVRHVRQRCGEGARVGILSTLATLETRLYQDSLERAGLEALHPAPDGCARVQEAISNREYGIKARNPVTERARADLLDEARRLAGNADAIILGCTEIPLALPEKELGGVPLIDATDILALELVRAFAPEKLR